MKSVGSSGEDAGSPWMDFVEERLDGLYQLEGVLNVTLARRDGIPVASMPRKSPETKRLAAMVAAVRGTSEIVTDELSGGRFREALVRSDRGELFCVAVGEDYVLSVLAEEGALTGLLFMAVGAAADQILKGLKGR